MFIYENQEIDTIRRTKKVLNSLIKLGRILQKTVQSHNSKKLTKSQNLVYVLSKEVRIHERTKIKNINLQWALNLKQDHIVHSLCRSK